MRDAALVGVVTFALLEVALRIYNPVYVPVRADRIDLPVNRTFTLRSPHNDKVDEFLVNRYNGIGLRGPEYPQDPQRYVKIFTVGGSTTACVALTDGRTWPDVAFRLLQAQFPQVWLNNAGIDGHSTFGHRILLDHHLQKYRPDYLVFLVGINDVGREDLNEFDERVTLDGASWRNRLVASSEVLATVQVLRRSMRAYDMGVNHYAADDLTRRRRIDPGSVDREAALASHRERYVPAYRARVDRLILRAREVGAEPVLVTQPALLGSGVDPTTGMRLDDLEFHDGVPASLQWDILELYNAALRELAVSRGVTLIDAAGAMPKDSALYFDWFHYSTLGAERMGEIVARGMAPVLAARTSARRPRQRAPIRARDATSRDRSRGRSARGARGHPRPVGAATREP